MDLSKMSADYIKFQRQSYHTMIDAMALVQDFTSTASKYWAHKLGVTDSGQDVIDKWRLFMKESYSISKDLIDQDLDLIEKGVVDLRSMFTPPAQPPAKSPAKASKP